MNSKKRSIWSVAIALTIILVGLFLVCSQRAATTNGSDDLSADDEQFRQELLEMLDLADDLDQQDTVETTITEDTGDDDVLSLLVPEEESTTTTTTTFEPAQTIETTPTETAANMGISEDMFRQIENEVTRLENILAERSTQADSLRRIIDRRDARIRQLETQLVNTSPVSRANTSSAGYSQTLSTNAEGGFMGAYHNARAQYESFQYAQAIASFQDLLNRYPNHSMADNCQYWIGECYFGLRQYQKAILEFQKVFAFSQTDKHDDAQLMIGMSYFKMGQPMEAREQFETFLNTYQGSEYTSVARRLYRNS
ncbi:tetratricopeptide repeat protein [candidate division KSB1 bacterium]|jgi:TolA-binding protein|nr:tetratricopeptide repeat protein [candidate division KSB1 bacterium]